MTRREPRASRERTLRLYPGKNVIVGRNNCGKSNIVKALDLVMGENNPGWARSENVTLNDFHSYRKEDEHGQAVNNVANELFIWCEITRDAGEALNYEELYKCYGFYADSDDADQLFRHDVDHDSGDADRGRSEATLDIFNHRELVAISQ